MDNQFVLSRLKMHFDDCRLMSKLISQLSCIFCHGRLLKLQGGGWLTGNLLQNNEHLLGYSPLEIEVLISSFIFGLPMCSVCTFLNGYGVLYV